MKRILFLILFPFLAEAQAPSGYYDGTSTLTGYALKSKLHQIISEKNINWHYGDLTNFYNQTDLDKYYDHDASNTTILLDIYSEIPNGSDSYEYTTANIVGSASAEGQGWNREHHTRWRIARLPSLQRLHPLLNWLQQNFIATRRVVERVFTLHTMAQPLQ